MIFKIDLNGTDTNPYHIYGLKMNPFPQYAKYEYLYSMFVLNSLGGDPIPNVEYIRNKLAGFHPSFIELICKHYKPGEMVRLEIDIPDAVLDLPFYQEGV